MGPSYSFLQFGPVAFAARLNCLWNIPKFVQATAAFRPSTSPPGVSPSPGCQTAASFGRRHRATHRRAPLATSSARDRMPLDLLLFSRPSTAPPPLPLTANRPLNSSPLNRTSTDRSPPHRPPTLLPEPI
jgi:hypothetical protein